MPGDPEFCRLNAARCVQLASGVTDRHLKEALDGSDDPRVAA